MRHFQVPFEAVEVKPWAAILAANPDAKPGKVSFREWASLIWLDDPRAYTNERGEQSIVKLRRWQKVIDLFELAKPGDWISLEDDDYEALKKIVESPTRAFAQNATLIALACMPYTDAVLDAKKEKPAAVVAAIDAKEEEVKS